MKKHPTRGNNEKQKMILCLVVDHEGKFFKVPAQMVAELKPYEVENRKVINRAIAHLKDAWSFSPDEVFADIREKYSKAGAYLKGIRLREGLNQIAFAKRIGVTQGDLSKMENGKRVIGKKLAQKIGKLFDFNYRNLL